LFRITTALALNYDFPHDFAGKDVLNFLDGVLPKCRPRAMSVRSRRPI